MTHQFRGVQQSTQWLESKKPFVLPLNMLVPDVGALCFLETPLLKVFKGEFFCILVEISCFILKSLYSWSLNNIGASGTDPSPRSQKNPW